MDTFNAHSAAVSRKALDHLSEELGKLNAPNEATFIGLGDALGAARAKLSAGSAQFNELSGRIDQGDGARTAQSLGVAREEVLKISVQGREIGSELGALGQTRVTIGRPLAALAKIIGEISALATNAKVQAAQVNAAGIDFTVFTKDIDRLRALAEAAVKRAEGRLGELSGIMTTAGHEAETFQRSGAAELESIANRLKTRLGELTQRRDQARRALADFQKRTAAIAERVSRCISALQINDLTSQRIGHVQTALGLLASLAEPENAAEPGLEWVAELTPERRQSLMAAVCSLQATQLTRASADFSAAVGELRNNLSGLANDALAIQSEAQRVFGGEHGNNSFIHTISADVVRAADLLKGYCASDERIRARIEQVSQGFTAMAEDLEAIQSIDADMRIMGLNATLKCTRLGQSGLALGVVAQELRACSRRTEETSKAIAKAIAKAAKDASVLATRSAQEYASAAKLAAELEESAQVLSGFGEILSSALHGMNDACGEVGNLLGEASQGCSVEKRLESGTAEIVRSLTEMQQSLGGNVDPALVRDDIHRMLGQHYTMASERVIHELFAENAESTSAAPPPTDNNADADIDDLFF